MILSRDLLIVWHILYHRPTKVTLWRSFWDFFLVDFVVPWWTRRSWRRRHRTRTTLNVMTSSKWWLNLVDVNRSIYYIFWRIYFNRSVQGRESTRPRYFDPRTKTRSSSNLITFEKWCHFLLTASNATFQFRFLKTWFVWLSVCTVAILRGKTFKKYQKIL